MATLTSLARALAADRDVAQPTATVRHVHLARRPLVLIPLALAGEANAPLAAMAAAAAQVRASTCTGLPAVPGTLDGQPGQMRDQDSESLKIARPA